MSFARRRSDVPRSFYRLTAELTAACTVAFVAASGSGGTDALASPEFWLLAALTVAMELLPIRLPRNNADDVITVSSSFALAALFMFGAIPAMALWTASAIVADVIGRIGPIKATFNAAQYGLCMASAALTLEVAGAHPPLTFTPEALPAMLAAATVFFAVNHVLAGIGIALLSNARVVPFLKADLGLLTWTTGFQLALAPMLLGAPGALVLLAVVPVMAIYLGGRQAAAATHRANHDALTGLVNRARFSTHLTEALTQRRRSGHETWVALIDLNDFKSINDTLGHHCGDAVLRHVAEMMRTGVRRGDVSARLGGDEFAVLLSECDRESALALAHRILDHLAEPVPVEDLSLRVSASVGLACCAGCDLDADALLRQADVALYRAKERQEPIAVYTASGRVASAGAALDRIAVGSALAEALDEDQVVAHFQPKVAAGGLLVPAMEALARWNHPQLGAVDPTAFVAIAEETGMIKRLTLRILDLALERCATWRDEGQRVRMCVNLSAKSLVDESLPELVGAALDKYGLPGDVLQFEITESACVANVPRSRTVLAGLRNIGVTLAIDDFGTGFSSLTQLQALDLEEVKIDRSFVIAMEHDPQAAVIVRSVVNLGHSLGLRVCAEGVESPAALGHLRELGCDYVQGYLFGQPAADAVPIGPAAGQSIGAVA